jgi:group II intron reverse transcriptase/maturase
MEQRAEEHETDKGTELRERIAGAMKTMNVLNENGLDSILSHDNLRAAYLKVKANKGAAGVDGIGVDELAAHIRKHWSGIEKKLRCGSYRPGLLRTVVIPKPGGGERELSIPNTQDRLIQQAICQPLSELFEPLFSEHSYGYRPGKSAHDAVRAMRNYVAEGKGHVVDVDIQRFFDEVNHDILMHQIGQQVTDRQVLRLIGNHLRAGKLRDGRKVRHNGRGIPQGGPMSPLLANIYLTPLDRQLEQWGVSFARYADDLTLFADSQSQAEALLERVIDWIAQRLKLRVNRQKSGTRPPDRGNFLGYRVEKDNRLALSEKNVARFKARVRELLSARNPWRWAELIDRWQQYVRGWWNYCRLSEWYEAKNLSRWCRRHVRKLCWQRWHNWKGRRNAFKRLGAKPNHRQTAHSSKGAWRIAASAAMQSILNNRRLLAWGFITPETLAREAQS